MASGLKTLARVLVLCSLASCASMQQSGSQGQADTREPGMSTPTASREARRDTPESAPQTAATANTDAGQVDNEEAPEINQVGRFVEYSRFVEPIPQIEVNEDDTVSLDYEQEELRIVIEEIGDILQINTVIDPTIDDRVSVRTSSDNPLGYDDLWPLLRLLTSNAGVTIEQAGNVYEFSKDNSNVPVEILMPDWLNDATSSKVLQVTPLRFISVESALEILTPMIEPESSIIRLGQANLIGISGPPAQLMRINALLQVIDDDPFLNRGIRLYELLNSQAADVAQELTSILALVEGAQPAYQVLGLERINSVLVIAPATRGFNEVTRWIRVLDADSQEQVEQLFFYKVKNLNATTLAATLTSVFERDDEEDFLDNDEEDTADDALASDAAEPAQNTADSGASSSIVSADLSVTIVADEDTNSLLVRSTPRDYRQLLTTINNLDTPPPQVLINAVIGQVTLTDTNQFGVDWTRVSANAASGPAQLSTRFLPGGLFNTTTGAPNQGQGLIFTRTFMDGSAIIDATLNAIAQDNEVRLLARPTILATNNQEGEIKVGQAVPINQGATTSGNGVTVDNIAYRDVGIVLTITPHINDDGFVNLEIFQSLSSIEQGSGGVGDNPTFTNQEITTTAVVSNESVITLGGLIQEDNSNQNTGVPGLQRIPLVGGLFSYQQNSTIRRELFIILRPQIINGDETDSVFMREFRSSFELVGALLREAGL